MQALSQLTISTIALDQSIFVGHSSPTIETFSCRICLQQMRQDQLLDVCKCKGSNGSVHEKCLIEWLRRSKKIQTWFGQCFTNCEICKDRIPLEATTSLRCAKMEQVKAEIFNQNCCCSALAMLVLFLCVLVFAIVCFIQTSNLVQTSSMTFMIIYLVLLGILLITLIIYGLKCMIRSEVADFKLGKRKPKSKETTKKVGKTEDNEFGFDMFTRSNTGTIILQ